MSDVFETKDTMRDTSDFEAGKVERMYTKGAEIKYPCVILSTDQVEMHFVTYLKGVVEKKNLLSVDSEFYYLYLAVGENPLIMIGNIRDEKLKTLFTGKIFRSWGKRAFLDKETLIEGEMLLALCRL